MFLVWLFVLRGKLLRFRQAKTKYDINYGMSYRTVYLKRTNGNKTLSTP